MSTRPTVSVIITTHDRPDLVRAAVDSVRAQSEAPAQVIVVDDGSASPLPALGTDVVVVRHEMPRGVCAARNRGLAAASGTHVMFLDDDDTLPTHALRDSLGAIAGSTLPPPVAALGSIAVVDDSGKVIETRRPPSFRRGAAWLFDPKPRGTTLGVQNTLVVPREVVVGIGGWNEQLKAWVHDDFFLRLCPSCSLQGTDRVTYTMLQPRWGRAHVSLSLRARAEAMERTLAYHQALFDRFPHRQAKYLGTIALTWLRVGEGRLARSAAWRSWCLHPRRRRATRQLAVSLAGPAAYRWASRFRDAVRVPLEGESGRPVP